MMQTFLYYLKLTFLIFFLSMIFVLGIYDLMLKYDANYLHETASLNVEENEYEYIEFKGYEIKIPKCIEFLK